MGNNIKWVYDLILSKASDAHLYNNELIPMEKNAANILYEYMTKPESWRIMGNVGDISSYVYVGLAL